MSLILQMLPFMGSSSPKGEAIFTTPGLFEWVCPPGVYSVCGVAIAGGYDFGGCLTWKNNIPVIPGQSYTIEVGGSQAASSAISQNILHAYPGRTAVVFGKPGQAYDGGGFGGRATSNFSGGGGAGGYLGDGGDGGAVQESAGAAGSAGSGGGGGGGQGGLLHVVGQNTIIDPSGGGGGTGLFGIGPSGPATSPGPSGGQGGNPGSGGEAGVQGVAATGIAGVGGRYGAGSGSRSDKSNTDTGETVATGPDPVLQSGAVRLIWGAGRSFPYNAA
jgi:hypothetical protein